MAAEIYLETPLTEEKARSLHAGDRVLLSGSIFTLRDAGHARLIAALDKGEELPVDLQDAIIFYVGPSPAAPGKAIGSAGPTSSYRMDPYTPRLLKEGLRGMIGKGYRSEEVVAAMKEHAAVYLGAIGGAGALISKTVSSAEVLAYEDLGTEALRRLQVKDLPLTVVIDSEGNNLYETGPAEWKAGL
ncbi:MAG: Fe-S-containing hydro-lyase [Clostridiaceae bacterium]|jgi:fumarate hydratase subunit beta|nr:Fe-S-containing hydro-lyase [Clostridiaceae bacterium]